jgi:hypothetical protein
LIDDFPWVGDAFSLISLRNTSVHNVLYSTFLTFFGNVYYIYGLASKLNRYSSLRRALVNFSCVLLAKFTLEIPGIHALANNSYAKWTVRFQPGLFIAVTHESMTRFQRAFRRVICVTYVLYIQLDHTLPFSVQFACIAAELLLRSLSLINTQFSKFLQR